MADPQSTLKASSKKIKKIKEKVQKIRKSTKTDISKPLNERET
jgi:hypothetical protein